MENAFGDSESSAGTMFPFLSVLACTIGAMIMILIAGSIMSRAPDKALADKKNKLQRVVEELTENNIQLAGLVREKVDLSTFLSGQSAELIAQDQLLTTRATQLKDLRLEEKKLAEEVDTLTDHARDRREMQVILEKYEAKENAKSIREEMKSMQERENRLRDEKPAIEKLHAELARSVRQMTARRQVLDRWTQGTPAKSPVFRVPTGERIDKVVFIEVEPNGVVVRSPGLPSIPNGSRISTDEAVSRSGKLDREFRLLAQPNNEKYVVLGVRPGASRLFHTLAQRLRDLRAPFGYEPVESDWRLPAQP